MSSLCSTRIARHLVPLLLVTLPIILHVQATSTPVVTPVPCLADQASALLRLKRSFIVTTDVGDSHSTTTFRSWVAGIDCCRWEGVLCGGADGLVTSLDLGGRNLQAAGLDPALFSLTSLKHLNLAGNDFNASQLPAVGFERLTELAHLDLSDGNFAGRVPDGIGRLASLVYLDLSTSFYVFELDRDTIVLSYESYSFSQLSEPNLGTLLANLTNLQELRLGMVNMSGNGVRWCDAMAVSTPKLQVLSLPYCSLGGPICGSFSALRSLVVIELHHNHLSGQVPEFLAGFTKLSVLQLSNNKLQGWFPPIIFQHKKLMAVDLSNNLGISGTLPNFSGNSILQNLSISSTNFSGTIPTSISYLKSLKNLGLGASGLSGILPSSLGTLKSLDSLEVSGLQLVGSMPSWISNLTSLTSLQFSQCGLSGPIPSSIANLRKLVKLALYSCHFSGVLPPHISNFTQLETLLLHSNNFVGTLELTSFLKMQDLYALDLSNNKLRVMDGGENSSSLVSFPDIGYLHLASCNISSFPNILKHLDHINSLDLSDNQIHGAIPHWAWETWKSLDFIRLNLSNNKFTSLGSDPLLPLYIEFFDLSVNYLEGPVPIPQDGSVTLDYSNNQFSCMPLNFSTYIGKTRLLKTYRNNLSGDILPLICHASSLQLIDLSYNNLSGPIPSCLMEDISALQVLSLRENQLGGKLPDTIKEGCAFRALDFSGNSIEGKIPRSLVACSSLEILDIGSNRISDSFPCWMSKLPELQVLVLQSNKFIGQIQDHSYTGEGNNCAFTKLRIADMASNNFSGTLPEGWFKMLRSMMTRSDNDTLVMEEHFYYGQTHKFTATLTYKSQEITISNIFRTLVLIDVSNNSFHGSIPEAIGELVLLHGLNMSQNALTGPIPTQFGNLNQLESLDLSSNELSGEIPKELASLNFLSTLNLSYNMLAGKIPDSSQFSTFSSSSFLGNTGLCGPPLSKQCNNLTETRLMPYAPEEKSVDVLLFLFTALGFGVCFAITIIAIWGRRSRKQSFDS